MENKKNTDCPVCGSGKLSSRSISEPFSSSTVIGSKVQTLFRYYSCDNCGAMFDSLMYNKMKTAPEKPLTDGLIEIKKIRQEAALGALSDLEKRLFDSLSFEMRKPGDKEVIISAVTATFQKVADEIEALRKQILEEG